MTLQGHTDYLKSVAVLPDGNAISASWDKTLKVWDLKSGQCVMTLQGHTSTVSSVAVLPDGNAISASYDNTLKVWSFGKMSLEFEPWRYLTDLEIEGLTIHWKSPPHLGLKNLKDLCQFLGKTHLISNHEIRCDDEESLTFFLQLVVGGQKTTAGLITLQFNMPQLNSLSIKNCNIIEGIEGKFTQLEKLSLESCSSLSKEKIIKILQTTSSLTHLDLGKLIDFDVNEVCAFNLSKLEHLEIAIFSENHLNKSQVLQKIRQSMPLLKTLILQYGLCETTLQGHTRAVMSVAVLPDGNAISASEDNTLKVWDPKLGQCLLTLQGHTQSIESVAVLPNGNAISASVDTTLKVWDFKSGQCVMTLQGHTQSVWSVAVLPDGNAISASDDNTLKVWELKTGQCVMTLKGHTQSVYSVAVLPDGNAISASDDNTLKVWELKTGQCVMTLKGHTQSVYSVAVLPDGNAISASADNTLKVWDLKTGQCVMTLKGHAGYVSSVAILPNGNAISASADNTLKVWDLKTGQCVMTLQGHTLSVLSTAVLPDGNAISTSFDNTLKVWSFGTMSYTFAPSNLNTANAPIEKVECVLNPSSEVGHVTHYLSERDKKAMMCVSQSFHGFFHQPANTAENHPEINSHIRPPQ